MTTARRAKRVLLGSALLWAAVAVQPALALQADVFTLPNGQKVRSTDPDGQRGKVNPDGSVTLKSYHPGFCHCFLFQAKGATH